MKDASGTPQASDLDTRRQRYAELSTALSGMSDDALLRALGKVRARRGWGTNQVLQLKKRRLFVKRVPVTEKELANPYSTKNVYQLPVYYNYGVGSAGFNVFRELLSHVKTTGWVLTGENEHFPLMYHHRIIRGRRTPEVVDEQQLERYVRYWQGSKRIGQYLRDRQTATSEAIVCLEHFPRTAGAYVSKKPSDLPPLLEQMLPVAEFLKSKQVIHFDAHLYNIVGDRDRYYLTDFGLLLDGDFDLSERERRFFRENRSYDRYQLLSALSWTLGLLLKNARTKQRIFKAYNMKPLDLPEARQFVSRHLEELVRSGLVTLDPKLFAMTLRYREIAEAMHSFYAAMGRGARKNLTPDYRRMSKLYQRVQTRA